MTDFKNPYVKNPDKKIFIHISLDDYNLFKCTHPGNGTLSSTFGTIIFKLANELRQRNITDVSKSTDFEQFIIGCHIVSDSEYRRLRDGAINQTSPGRSESGADERGTTTEFHSPSSVDETELPNLQGQNGGSGGEGSCPPAEESGD